jgi:hypothetical protein
MASYIGTRTYVTKPRFGHAWRDETGGPHATVDVCMENGTYMAFDDPAIARAVAAACEKAAEAMEALAPAGRGTPETRTA